MSVRATVTKYLRRRAALWERRRTERFISSLPAEIRKDIGWRYEPRPDSAPAPGRNQLLERRW